MLTRRGAGVCERVPITDASMNNKVGSITDLPSIFDGGAVDQRYVAFIDLLGFGARVENEFDATVLLYQSVLDSADIVRTMRPDVKLKVMSDAFIVTSEKLGSMIGVIQALHMQTLFNDCLVRGGIGFGKHIESSNSENVYVVSQGLVQAVSVEKKICYPCVAFHESIDIPSHWWVPHLNPFQRGVLFFEGIRLVNPFNIAWGQSAMTRVASMPRDNPKHNKKYDWFLRLYQAVISGESLVPPQ